ncbi:GntR family transcriptional regulator [Bombilactobacillus thymidiniphilus]|uniref:GntR family transcriptional regulator n=1 Tax=Bombilactobacillus thymidiniphilus TaxID=2923363 RepID=A0ABY4PFS3_9LACO|nr:GntR family transcriptional regulator [Bombilactobacillus thymidiniphilus]UQS84366.1 GntR family transcriptional regulator [Bombilactobacillus thymidiniphilus]
MPIYVQIHNTIKQDIAAGKWKIGQRIPSERELATSFKVSRMTLRQAVQTLVDEGILQRKVGSGTFVARQKVQEKMSGTTSFTDIMLAQGKKPSSRVVSYHMAKPTASERDHLRLVQLDQVLRMERIRLADQLPICFEITTVPIKIVENLSRQEITQSFYHALEQKGYELGHAQQTVSSMLSSEKVSDLLNIKRGSAILRLRQITYLANGQPFEYVRTQYVGERFEFYLER